MFLIYQTISHLCGISLSIFVVFHWVFLRHFIECFCGISLSVFVVFYFALLRHFASKINCAKTTLKIVLAQL